MSNRRLRRQLQRRAKKQRPPAPEIRAHGQGKSGILSTLELLQSQPFQTHVLVMMGADGEHHHHVVPPEVNAEVCEALRSML